ncbi:hypothetical protein [Caulobacter endophyticus]|uniref:hypothetical protein n=1 Tax=Caulobacter endophyticus TaxID=2172652 RepID=UPI00240FB508|nr:hypothetical protein [Caulobacter endophyticus]MDG2530366.1 hypothetical protein [Caulobacter endophyticus]
MIHRFVSRVLAGLSLATTLGLGGAAQAAQPAAPAAVKSATPKPMACEPLYAFVASTPPGDSHEAVFFWPADETADTPYMYAVLAGSPSTPDEARTVLWEGYAQATHNVELEKMAKILADCLAAPAGRKLTALRPATVDLDCTGEPTVRARGACLRFRVGPQR